MSDSRSECSAMTTLECNSIVKWAYGSTACHVIISGAYQQRHRVLAHSLPLITRLHWSTHTLLRDSRPSDKALWKNSHGLSDSNPCIATNKKTLCIFQLLIFACVEVLLVSRGTWGILFSVRMRWKILIELTLILRRSRTGTVWFYTSTSNKRAARPKLYTKSLTRDLKLMYSRLTLVRISINL